MTVSDSSNFHSLVRDIEEIGTLSSGWAERDPRTSWGRDGKCQGSRHEFIIDTGGLYLPTNQEGSHYGAKGLASHLVGTNYSTSCLLGIGFLCMKWYWFSLHEGIGFLGGPKNTIGQFEGILKSPI